MKDSFLLGKLLVFIPDPTRHSGNFVSLNWPTTIMYFFLASGALELLQLVLVYGIVNKGLIFCFVLIFLIRL